VFVTTTRRREPARGVDDAALARVFGGNWQRVRRQVWEPARSELVAG